MIDNLHPVPNPGNYEKNISLMMDQTLRTFQQAQNWKKYFITFLSPYLKGDLCEVGAGRADNFPYLHVPGVQSLVGLEPDERLAQAASLNLQNNQQIICGSWEKIPEQEFDGIIYLDVLEHIENDQQELNRALSHLRPGGHLMILVPAHQFLYTPFDKKIGHYRRYNKKMLNGVIPKALTCQCLRYLDSVGVAASMANRLLLKTADPTPKQIAIWDKLMIPCSRLLDPLLGHQFGKSLLGIWAKA